MRLVFFAVLMIYFFNSSYAEEAVNGTPLRLTITPEIAPGVPSIYEMYIPRTAKCSESLDTAKGYASEQWNQLPPVEKAKYLMETYKALNARHGFDYSYRILTCKAYRESTFDTQIDTGIPGSSARGISQAVKDTVEYLFRPKPKSSKDPAGFGFKSKLRGFENLTGAQVFEEMCGSMLLQMEVGLAVMDMKSAENNGTENAMKLMASYYGHPAHHCCNELFGRSIYDCATCIRDNGDVPTQKCLDQAKYEFIKPDIKNNKGEVIQIGHCEKLSGKVEEKWQCYPQGLIRK
jgi:hypothetical protein